MPTMQERVAQLERQVGEMMVLLRQLQEAIDLGVSVMRELNEEVTTRRICVLNDAGDVRIVLGIDGRGQGCMGVMRDAVALASVTSNERGGMVIAADRYGVPRASLQIGEGGDGAAVTVAEDGATSALGHQRAN